LLAPQRGLTATGESKSKNKSKKQASSLPIWHRCGREADDGVMVDAEETETGRRIRKFRSVSEKRRIAELTFVPGASVALVARAHGVNANQVFKWRRELKRGELVEPATGSTAPDALITSLF
jgi:hypothetical protein